MAKSDKIKYCLIFLYMSIKLLHQLDALAHNEGRGLLLDGIIEGDPYTLRSVFENQVNFETDGIFDDDFFPLLLQLAAINADHKTWSILSEWGFGMESAFYTDVKSHQSLSVGEWSCIHLPLERLHQLQNWGVLNPHKEILKQKNSISSSLQMLTDDQRAMIKGDDEHFEYWFNQWKITESVLANRFIDQYLTQSQHNYFVKRQIPVPVFMEALAQQKQYAEKKLNKNFDHYPDYLPNIHKLTERSHLLMEQYYYHWWLNPKPNVLEQISQSPPHGNEIFLHDFAAWAVSVTPNAFVKPVELDAVRQGYFEWVRALLQNKAPLFREENNRPLELVENLLQHENALDALKVWLKRADKENPDLLQNVFNLSINHEPLEFYLVGQWPLFQHMIKKGCPLDRSNSKNQNLVHTVLLRLIKSLHDQQKFGFYEFESWMVLRNTIQEQSPTLFAKIPGELGDITQEKDLRKLLRDRGATQRLLERIELQHLSVSAAKSKSPGRRL